MATTKCVTTKGARATRLTGPRRGSCGLPARVSCSRGRGVHAAAAAGTADVGASRSLKDLTLPELEEFCVAELGEPKKRARHIWKTLYGDKFLLETLEDGAENEVAFSSAFLSKVDGRVHADAGLRLVHTREAGDGTKKLIFQREEDLAAGMPMNIETVLIPAGGEQGRKPRVTVCVSSQIGCAMGCKFCYTGLMGLQANLTAGEIVEQVIAAKRMQRGEPFAVTNIVFMGMGEPFHNIDAVLKAIEILTTPSAGYTHFSQRKITVSTVGLVPEMRRFAVETNAQLALSLHATEEATRSAIVPANNKHSLAELVATLKDLYPKGVKVGSHGRHVLIEYVMLAGVNDTLEDAERLVGLLDDVECKVNLLVFNSFDGSPFVPSSLQVVKAFRAAVVAKGLVCTIRNSRGDDEMAACGQLGFNVKKQKQPQPQQQPQQKESRL